MNKVADRSFSEQPRVTGFLDRVEDERVSGWAFDPEHPNEPVLVTLVVNGRAVASALAALHREDAALAVGSRGYHGFHFDLRECDCVAGPAVIECRASDGALIHKSPLSVIIPEGPASSKSTVIFLHIPKTAGTALREAIECSYPPSERLYLYAKDNFFQADLPVWRFPLDHRARLRFIVGHFLYGLHEAFPQECDYITVVRRPFERLVSQYSHWVRNLPERVSAHGRVLPLSEVLADPQDVSMDNLMVRYFAGVDHFSCPVGAVDVAVFERAIENIRKHFRYIATAEDMSVGYEILAHRYGWNRARSLLYSNVGGGVLAPREYSLAEKVSAESERWDIRLYQQILTIFGHHSPACDSA